MTAYELQSVPTTLNKMKMLFWRLDLSKRSFVNLNDCTVGVLARENYRFFKDRGYREQLLFPDDRVLLDRAVANFKERVPVRTVFRIQSDNTIYWFKITGWPTNDNRFYEGAVEEITEHISWLKNVFAHEDQRLLQLENDHYPVALFTEPGNKMISCNPLFQDLFDYDVFPGKKIKLDELFSINRGFPQILENLFLQRRLNIELVLNGSAHPKFKVSCQLEYFTSDGIGHIRLAILNQLNATPMLPARTEKPELGEQLKQLCDELAHKSSIDAMLDSIYEAKDLFPGMDVVMFSDIYARKNKVVVYSKGDLLETLEAGSSFPYVGTIAENIEKEDLEYLIVDDTQSSIKAIDWMLFVPKGLFSYVAKALYVRGAMRTVLIFCSKKKNSFSEDQIGAVTAITTAFHQQLKKIRQKSKT